MTKGTTPSASILIIDDDAAHAEATAEALQQVGHRCQIATGGEEGLKAFHESEGFDLVVTDLIMADVDGFEILRRVKERSPDVEVIVLTGHGTVQSAVEAMEKGAHTYLTKPVTLEELRAKVAKAIEKQGLVRSNVELRRQLDRKFGFTGILGNSAKMQRIFDTLQQISATSATVLITGESGTGKELLARAIHNNSGRRQGPFVALNCAALSESILESELFGHEKGAFTGADHAREGRFEAANSGTLFLDEVGDIPLTTQVKLLRVIENREIIRVGSNEPRRINVRLIAATNTDLKELIDQKKFREDLYYRLKVVSLDLPPLRERREDIPLLVNAFLEEFSREHVKTIAGISSEARKILLRHDWPGNVRELKNCIESMVVVTKNSVLDVQDIPEHVGGPKDEPGEISSLSGITLQEAERQLIKNTLALTDGNRTEAARILGIGERTLYRKINEYSLRE
ncbi:MAG: sigma-54-dependent Fis family transcriptional regulator [Planctomycetes bacterium]|nr:sigma-54-dependent Fis family transcriptional regulator [Planctomycetota bacterium]